MYADTYDRERGKAEKGTQRGKYKNAKIEKLKN